MPNLKSKNVSLYYECHGKGDPLILIPGFGVDHTTWNPVIPLFSKNYQVIVFDNRGSGQSTIWPEAYSIEQLAEDVLALCHALGIKKANVIGNSMGGFIVQTLIHKYPNLIQAAVISNSTIAPEESAFHFYLEAHLELLKAGAPSEALIKAFYTWVFSFQFLSKPNMLESLIQLALNNPYPFTISGYEAQLAAIKRFNSTQWINEVNVPTLVVTADNDLIFSPSASEAMAKIIPKASYYCFKNCGHLPHIEYPELFVENTVRFIQNKSKAS